jgi:hypothetical protein
MAEASTVSACAGTLDAAEMRAAVGATPETEEHHHHEPAAYSHRYRLSHHVRLRGDVRQREKASPEDRKRADEHWP